MRNLVFGMAVAAFLVGGISVAVAEDSLNSQTEQMQAVCARLQEAVDMLKKATTFEEAFVATEYAGVFPPTTEKVRAAEKNNYILNGHDEYVQYYIAVFTVSRTAQANKCM
jgi:hypothetical protein